MHSAKMISIKNLSCGYSSKNSHTSNIIDNFSLDICPGEVLCILGKNGVGKTTLFRTLLGSIEPISGEVKIDDNDLFTMSRKEKASIIAYVPQSHNPPFAYTAFDIVLMGRAGLISALSMPSENDKKLALEAMEMLEVSHLAERLYTKISGGERQMILIARAIAQGAKYLFLDEPTANLDFGNQMKVLGTLKSLSESGKGVIFTSHDPSHALLLNSKVTAIKSSSEFEVGLANDVVTKNMAEMLYGIRAEIVEVYDEKRGENVKIFASFLE